MAVLEIDYVDLASRALITTCSPTKIRTGRVLRRESERLRASSIVRSGPSSMGAQDKRLQVGHWSVAAEHQLGTIPKSWFEGRLALGIPCEHPGNELKPSNNQFGSNGGTGRVTFARGLKQSWVVIEEATCVLLISWTRAGIRPDEHLYRAPRAYCRKIR